MNLYTVSFFGHRQVERFNYVEERISELVRGLIESHKYVEFLVGRNGEFDQLVSSAIKRAQRNYGVRNSSHVLVLPYISAELRENKVSFLEYYDEIELTQGPHTHFKAALQERNRAMVDRSDLVVFYLERESGGTYQTCI